MRVSALAMAVMIFLAGHSLSVSSCYGQTATTGNPPKAAPAKQVPKAPPFTAEQQAKIREIVKEELVPVKERIDPWIYLTRTTLWVVGIIAAALVGIAGIALWQTVGGLKRKAESHIRQMAKLLEQSQMVVQDIEAIHDNAKKQAEGHSAEIKAKGEQILAELGKTFTHSPRYVLVQGGTIDEPSWKFDLVLLPDSNTHINIAGFHITGFLRMVGGTACNNLTEKDKATRDWHECLLTFGKGGGITLKRPLVDDLAGKDQYFHGESPPTIMPIKTKTARVWQGHWSGYGAEKAPGLGAFGAFIVYLD